MFRCAVLVVGCVKDDDDAPRERGTTAPVPNPNNEGWFVDEVHEEYAAFERFDNDWFWLGCVTKRPTVVAFDTLLDNCRLFVLNFLFKKKNYL